MFILKTGRLLQAYEKLMKFTAWSIKRNGRKIKKSLNK